MANIQRIFKHLLSMPGQVKRKFSQATLDKIEQAIHASEATHRGEIRFAVEGDLDGAPLFKGQSARERAVDLFSQLRVWDTADNTGVLIYLLLADHAVEIVADRGIQAHVGPQEWRAVCEQMEAAFRRSDFEGGVLRGVAAVSQLLVKHFPAHGPRANELPNQAVVL